MMVCSCWVSRLFLISALLFATSNGDYSTGALQAIRCMLSHATPTDCAILPEVMVPSYLVQAYNDSPSSLHKSMRSTQLSELSNSEVGTLPLSLLYLIPRSRLCDLNGTQMGAILQNHPEDTSLAQQVAACLQHGKQLLQLIHKLKLYGLSQRVQKVLGENIAISDLNEDFFNSLPFLQEPILAYLHPTTMLKLESKTFYKVLFQLKEVNSSKLPRKETIHVISQAAMQIHYPLSKINWLVLGLTSDELKNDSLILDLTPMSFKLEFTIMQARAVFERVYYNVTLHQSHFIDSKPLLSKLTPTQLQRFPVRDHKYDTLTKLPSPLSLSTACQIMEYVKTDCKLTGRLPKDEEEWDSRIRYLGPWVYTLPLSAMEEYLLTGLNTASLQSIDSSALSPMQAYYLTGCGKSLNINVPNSIMGLDKMLHALPASQLVNRKVGEISSYILEHLVANLPGDNLPRTLSLVHKIASSIGEPHILGNLLNNNDVNTIMSLVSPKDLQASAPRILKFFANKSEFWSIIQKLPQQVLAALLEESQKNSEWSWHNLLDTSQVSHLLLGGLTCQHIQDMDTGLFIPIMAQYNILRKQAFPKNLQHCCLKKLISHLELKMVLTQTNADDGLISILEPIEIESVGGYVLLGLPVEDMKISPYLSNILTAIGKLSSTELMLAQNITRIKAVAQLAVDKNGYVDAFHIGNLSWFVPPSTKIPELKLILEAGLLDTTLCVPTETRHAVAVNILAQFGPPEGWSAGVLATLQDLLLVFTNDELQNISKAAWTEAADCLKSHYTNNINWIDHTPFFKVCADILGNSEAANYKSAVSNLARWQLRAAQWQLNAVYDPAVPTTHILLPINYSNLDQQPDMTIHIFNPMIIEEISSSSTEFTTEEISSESTVDQITSFSNKYTTEESSSIEFTTEMIISSTEEFRITEPKTEQTNILTESAYELTEDSSEYTTEQEMSFSTKSTTMENNSNSIELTSKEIMSTSTKPITGHSTGLSTAETKYKTQDADYNSASKEGINTIKNNPLIYTNKIFGSNEVVSTETNPSTSSVKTNYFSTAIGNSDVIPRTMTKTREIVYTQQTSNTESYGADDMNVQGTTNITTTKKVIKNNINNSSTIYYLGMSTHKPQEIKVSTGRSTHQFTNVITEPNVPAHTTIDMDIYDDDDDRSEINTIIDNSTNSSRFTREKRGSVQPKLTCNALKMVGTLATVALTEHDLVEMADTELDNCKLELGKMDLSILLRKQIWSRIKKDGIHLLGNLLQMATVGDVWEVNPDASEAWKLETIHAFIKNVNDTLIIKKLLSEVQNLNSEFPPELLAVLGESVCALAPENLATLSVVGFQSFSNCPVCLPLLADKAVQQFGSVSTWTPHHIHILDGIVAGLDLENWKTLISSTYKPLSALQPSAIRCLNTSHLEALKPASIAEIPMLTLLALTDQQRSVLQEKQLWALENTTQLIVSKKLAPSKIINVAGFPFSAGSHHLMAALCFILCMILHLVLRSE